MYIPKHFEETDVAVLHKLIADYPLGVLLSNGKTGLQAEHIPFLHDPQPGPLGRLCGHVARANPLWRTWQSGEKVLVVFQGPESYITPSWYPTKRETGKVVPTWNYAVVHAHGSMRFVDDAEWLRGLLPRLTHEREFTREIPWSMSDAPDDYMERSVSAVVGVEITVERLDGKWKMSQNKLPRDIEGIMNGLQEEGGDSAAQLAAVMRARLGGQST